MINYKVNGFTGLMKNQGGWIYRVDGFTGWMKNQGGWIYKVDEESRWMDYMKYTNLCFNNFDKFYLPPLLHTSHHPCNSIYNYMFVMISTTIKYTLMSSIKSQII